METFTLLPDELLRRVMYMLDYHEIQELGKTHKRAKLIVEDKMFWRDKINLISPGRDNLVINKSVKTLITMYRTMEKSGYIYGFGDFEFGDKPRLIPGFDNVVQISWGFFNTAFLTTQGEVYVWGSNAWGQLGLGDTSKRTRPTKIENLPPIKYISCGKFHTALVTDQGYIYTFGDNDYGQLGLREKYNQEVTIPTLIPGYNNVVQVSCGVDHTAFVTEDGTLYVMGNNVGGRLGLDMYGDKILVPIPIPGFNNITQVSCGKTHTAFLTEEGKVYVFGGGSYGQLGIGIHRVILRPTQLPNVNDVIQISCGYYYTSYVTKNGEVYSFGSNEEGELGLGDKNNRSIPTLVKPTPKITQVCCGSSITAFIDDNGEVYVCGLLRSTAEDILIPSKINNFTNVVQISCGNKSMGFIVEKKFGNLLGI